VAIFENPGRQRAVLQHGRTYGLYQPNNARANFSLAIGVPLDTRLESVAIDEGIGANRTRCVTENEMSAIYLNFADAVMLERYLEKFQLDSFEGVCLVKSSDTEITKKMTDDKSSDTEITKQMTDDKSSDTEITEKMTEVSIRDK
jgi:hypothetical protein